MPDAPMPMPPTPSGAMSRPPGPPPMPPTPPGAMPPMPRPPGPPPGGPPGANPPGGIDDALKAKVQEIAMSIPSAPKPLPTAAVESVVEAFNEAKEALIPHIAGEMPMPVPDMGDKFSKLPVEVYVPIALLLEELAQLDPKAQKYACDPTTLSDVAGLRTLAGKLKALAKDKSVKAAIEAKMMPPEEEMMDEEMDADLGPEGPSTASRFTKT